jgi:RNA polymerase sigma-70 factor (ECF subfamily)
VNDEELVGKIINGDVRSYGDLMVRYEAPLLRYITYLIHDRDMADDVLQDTFIKAYRNLARFNQRRKFSSWIYRSAHNPAMDAVKKNHPISMDEATLGSLATVESGIAEQIDKEILAHDVGRCLSQLDTKYSAPLLLHYFQHKNYTEVSDILRIPSATVGVRISRGKQRLREICKKLGVKS